MDYGRAALTNIDKLSREQKKNKERLKQSTVPYNYTGPIVTFIDDDNKKFFMDSWKKVCDAKGIRVTLAVIPANTTGSDSTLLNTQDLKALQNDGYEIVSHTWGHDETVFKPTVTDLTKVTDAAIDEQYKKGKEWLESNGFTGSNVVVYPWGGFGSETVRYKRIARKYHEYGVDAAGTHNLMPHDNMWLRRPFLYKTNPDSNFQTSVDNALTSNAWLIFGTHSQSDQIDEAFLTRVVEYIQSKNIPIMTFGEALKYKGNAMSVGEFTDTSKRFYVGADGSSTFVSTTVVKEGIQPSEHGYDMTTLAAAFPYQTVTVFKLRNTYDTVTNAGGTVSMYRVDGSTYYNYQTFVNVNGRIFYRTVKNDGTWNSWIELMNKADMSLKIVQGIYTDVAGQTMNDPITKFDQYKTTIVYIRGDATADPLTGKGGTLETYRGGSYMSFQKYYVSGTDQVYYRRWSGTDAAGAWVAWRQIAFV